MKRIPFLAIVLLACAFPAHAQDAMKDAMKKDAAVKPADPEMKVVLDSWNEIGRKLTAMAEDFPEDKYDFKPTPAQRSFAEQLLHAAGSCYYFTNPVMGKKPPAAEDLLESGAGFTDLQSSFDVGDITDVVATMKRIAVDIHQKIMERYADNPANRYILSGGGIFLISFAAACGRIRNLLNMTSLNGSLERLMKELAKPGDDPLNLDEYQHVVTNIKSSRGKAMRRLVYDTFLRFFNGTTQRLDWTDAARQMSV